MSERLVLRHAGRSSLTIGVLFIAVSAGVGTSNAVFSVTDDVRTWYERTVPADFLIRAMMPDMTGQDAVTLPDSIDDEIAALDEVEKVEAVRLLRIEAAGQDADDGGARVSPLRSSAAGFGSAASPAEFAIASWRAKLSSDRCWRNAPAFTSATCCA